MTTISIKKTTHGIGATWLCCRNFLVLLIVLQAVVLIGIGLFATPSTTSMFFSMDNAATPFDKNNNNDINAWDLDTYDVPGALTLNFQKERVNPSFRATTNLSPTYWEDQGQKVVSLIKSNSKLTSCQYYSSNESRILLHTVCQYEDKDGSNNKSPLQFVAYNPLDFPRTWCGVVVPPKTAVHMKTLCDQPVHLLPADNLELKNAKQLPPIKLQRQETSSSASTSALEEIDCDVPCHVTMDTCDAGKGHVCLPQVSKWTVQDTPFQFHYYYPKNPEAEARDRKAYRQHDYIVSQSVQSEIPLSSFDWRKFPDLPSVKDDWQPSVDTQLPSIVFLQSKAQCSGSVPAGAWVEALSKSFGTPVHSMGACANNQAPPKDVDVTDATQRRTVFHKYMFTLIVEGSMESESISELIWEALWAGSIPVHVGNSDVPNHVFQHSIISSSTVGNKKEELGAYLKQVSTNHTLWSEYHAWRSSKAALSDWKSKYDYLKATPYCRMCRLSYAKQYGLGWNHEQQTVTDNHINRQLCVSGVGLITNNMNELWWTNTHQAGKPKGESDCEYSSEERHTQTYDFVTHNVTRSVVAHDGVIDFAIHATESERDSGELLLRLQFRNGLQNMQGAHFPHVHTLVDNSPHSSLYSSVAVQDADSRVTVLANWPTLVTSTLKGYIDILIQTNGNDRVVQGDETRRIRVVMENMDPLRDVPSEYYMSYYTNKMVRDFMDPLELYYVDNKE